MQSTAPFAFSGHSLRNHNSQNGYEAVMSSFGGVSGQGGVLLTHIDQNTFSQMGNNFFRSYNGFGPTGYGLANGSATNYASGLGHHTTLGVFLGQLMDQIITWALVTLLT
ncbi:hypothetical protein L1987_47378 [Smallanthus sonchifolius]|uniref:Uncharacterized protein n=1 Tax=Smallanthus sonchifolius TaxID=185202 RepID=A0ACB9G296_9ASTR|nr:hypothetical protein L1987_47378 [Smallanthus sonchifolius]